MTDWSTLLLGLGLGWTSLGILLAVVTFWPTRYTPRHKQDGGDDDA